MFGLRAEYPERQKQTRFSYHSHFRLSRKNQERNDNGGYRSLWVKSRSYS